MNLQRAYIEDVLDVIKKIKNLLDLHQIGLAFGMSSKYSSLARYC